MAVLGIIEVTDTGDKKIPQFRYDKILFEVAIEEF
jgi:predicted transcriptional regulator